MRHPFERCACTILAIVALAAGQMCAQSPQVQDAFRRGATALHNGQNADAERAFRDAIRIAPDLADAHLDLGLVLGREGKRDDAIASLKRAIELDPSLPSAHMFLGVFLYQTNQRSEAIDAINQELALNPKNVEALTWMGIVQLADSHPERAVGPLDLATAITPDDLNLLEYRGKAHSLVARDSYARMAQLNPNAWQVHKVRAELYAEDSKYAEAAKEYEAAIRQEERNPDLREALGDQYRRLNDLDSARKAYEKELELAPQNPIAMYNLGSTEIDLGDYAAGVQRLEEMLRIYRGSAVAEYYLGRGLAALGRDNDALPWLEKSVQEDKEGEVAKRAYYELARVYRKLQRAGDAQLAMSEYNRLRVAREKLAADKIEAWRKLDMGNSTSPTK